MPEFPLPDGALGPADFDRAAAARDRGWNVWQREDRAWSLRAADDSGLPALLAFLRAYDPLAAERAAARARVAAEADRRVALLGSERRLLALIARGVEIHDKRLAGQPLDPEDELDAEAARAAQRANRRLRRAQAEVEADLAALATTDALRAFDPARHPRWPRLDAEAAAMAAAAAKAAAAG